MTSATNRSAPPVQKSPNTPKAVCLVRCRAEEARFLQVLAERAGLSIFRRFP